MNMNALPTSSQALAAIRPAGIVLHIAAAWLLGALMVYAVEFSESPLAHNAAHDMRHANGRPCH